MGAMAGPSLREYVWAQVSSRPTDNLQVTKHERVYNFIRVPGKLEHFLFFGYWVCLDAFLHIFTVLPLRIFLSIISTMASLPLWLFGFKRRCSPVLWPDLLKGLMMIVACAGVYLVDSSRLYHSIRGQSTLKLYVIYNVLEVADKLCASFGLDVMDSFSSGSGMPFGLLPHFLLTVIYLLVHSIVLFYQAITLNVAINSYNNALLTLLVSNQFVEIKSAVFKKFEKENLFQLSCADVIERFQLSIYLLIVGLRNFSEMYSNLDAKSLLEGLLFPLAVVYLSEIAVDWLKHAFITKFNHIQPDVYLKFCQILAKDFDSPLDATVVDVLADRSPQVSRRIGFSAFPLACLLIRVLMQFVVVYDLSWTRLWPHLVGLYCCALLIKLIVGINLAAYARKWSQVQQLPNGLPPKKIFSSQSQIIIGPVEVKRSSSLDDLTHRTP